MKLYFLILLSTAVLSDTIHLKNGKWFNGQLIKVNSSVLIFEIYKNNGEVIHNITLEKEEIKKVIDESGMALYEDNKLIKPYLDLYYYPLSSLVSMLCKNEQSNEMDSLYTLPHSKKIGHIKKVFANSLIIEIQDKNLKMKKEKIPFEYIVQINGFNFQKNRNRFSKKEYKRANYYPKFAFEFGTGFAITQLSSLKNIFQKFQDYGETNRTVDNTQSVYTGYQISLLLKFSPQTGIGYLGHISFAPGEDYYRISVAELRYSFDQIKFRPWCSIGYSMMSVQVTNIPAIWTVGSEGLSLGLGFETGGDTGFGIITAIRFLPFGKKDTKLNTYSAYGESNVNLGTTDLSVFILSLGLKFNY